jgi:hypothetical protein
VGQKVDFQVKKKVAAVEEEKFCFIERGVKIIRVSRLYQSQFNCTYPLPFQGDLTQW